MKRNRRRAGVTLIEIMVVLVIMSAIAAAVGFAVVATLAKARKRETETRARTLQHAALAYLTETPSVECPTVEDLIREDIVDKTTDQRDAWGRAFAIECDGRTVHVRSSGPDGQAGNEDDVGF